jgi:hypothetical protein
MALNLSKQRHVSLSMSHFRLAQIVIVLQYFFIRTGEGTDDSFGNELAQFHRYVSIADKHSVINASAMYEMYRACEEEYTSQNLKACHGDMRSKIAATRLPLWKPERNPKFPKKYQRDCEYVLSAAMDTSYSFHIEQSACRSEFSLSSGGSTFEISASSSEFLALCLVRDNFDNSYSVRCEVPYSGERKSSECLKVAVRLESEHFDAFSDIGVGDYVPLEELLKHDNVCIKALSDKAVQSSNQFWFQSNLSSAAINPLPPYETYAWGSMTPKYYTRSSMDQCYAKSEIIFVGESHLCYLFDVSLNMYVDKRVVPKKHSNMSVSGMSFKKILFATRIADFLDEITCTSHRRVTTFILQTGSWDLMFFPPRGFINSPYQSKAVVMAMKRLWARIKDQCEDHVRIVWMSTMPHPLCKDNEMDCSYWRNNAAISAVNEQLRIGLSDIGMKRFTYVDTGRVLLPRFHWKEVAGHDHFLVAGGPNGIATTPGGMALLHQVLSIACASFVDIEADSKNPSHSQGNSTYCTEGARYRSKSGSHFLVHEGWKREVPDPDTGKYMGAPFHTFITVEDAVLDDIPNYFGSLYPSRKTYGLLKTKGNREIFFMDGGVRRSVSRMSTLHALGMDPENATTIEVADMLAIPVGKKLHSRADCLHCNSLTALEVA